MQQKDLQSPDDPRDLQTQKPQRSLHPEGEKLESRLLLQTQKSRLLRLSPQQEAQGHRDLPLRSPTSGVSATSLHHRRLCRNFPSLPPTTVDKTGTLQENVESRDHHEETSREMPMPILHAKAAPEMRLPPIAESQDLPQKLRHRNLRHLLPPSIWTLPSQTPMLRQARQMSPTSTHRWRLQRLLQEDFEDLVLRQEMQMQKTCEKLEDEMLLQQQTSHSQIL